MSVEPAVYICLDEQMFRCGGMPGPPTCASAVPRADPVQQVVHDLVLQPVAHGPAHPGGTHPTLLPEHPKRLGDSVFRSAQRGGEVADADARGAVKAEQDFQSMGVGEQIEALGPAADVDISQRRRRAVDLVLVAGLGHYSNLILELPGKCAQARLPAPPRPRHGLA
jgi:hypothetical protein